MKLRTKRVLALSLAMTFFWDLGWSIFDLRPPQWTYFLFSVLVYIWVHPWITGTRESIEKGKTP